MKKIILMSLITFFLFFIYMDNLIADVAPTISFSDHVTTCSELLGTNLTTIVRAGLKIIQFANELNH